MNAYGTKTRRALGRSRRRVGVGNMRLSIVILLVLMGCLTACVPPLRDAVEFNKPLEMQDPNESFENQPLSCLSVTGGTEACLRPGMKLVTIESDARDHSEQDRTIVAARNEWVIPSPDRFSQEDLFHLSWLLSVSTAKNGHDPSLCYEAWLNSGLYPDRFRREFLVPLLRSLRVTFNTGSAPGPGLAADVKRWMRDLPPLTTPGSDVFYSRQVLKFELPLLPSDAAVSDATPTYCRSGSSPDTFLALEGGSPFQRERVDLVEKGFTHPGGWYKNVPGTPIVEARVYVAVLVPVTLSPSSETHFVPIDSSLADVATTFHQQPGSLVGVWRDARLIPKDLGNDYARCAAPSAARIFIVATDTDHYVCQPGLLQVKRSVLDQMLVAPNDEFVF